MSCSAVRTNQRQECRGICKSWLVIQLSLSALLPALLPARNIRQTIPCLLHDS